MTAVSPAESIEISTLNFPKKSFSKSYKIFPLGRFIFFELDCTFFSIRRLSILDWENPEMERIIPNGMQKNL
jgi:hypothetical protein